MDHMAVHLGHLWKAVREELGCFTDLLGDFVASDNNHGGTKGPKVNKHERRPAKGLTHGGKREVCS